MAKASWTYRDKSGETSTVELNIADVSVGGADFDTVMTALADLGADILAITECVQAREVFVQAVDVKSQLVPTDVMAQRESGLRIFYQDDTTGEPYHITIPGPDWDTVDLLANTDLADLTQEPLASFVSGLEADALSPVGNAITVLRAVQVGRKN